MDSVRRLSEAIVDNSRIVIVVLLLLSVAIGAGAAQVSQSSSLDQFSSDTPEAQAQEYLGENFTLDENTTSVQVIVRGENTLSRDSLLRQLEFEQSLLDNESVNATLAAESPAIGISNLVATTAIRQEQGQALQQRAAEIEAQRAQLTATAGAMSDALNRTKALQAQFYDLNVSYSQGDISQATYEERAAAIEANLTAAREQGTATLSANQTAEFGATLSEMRALQRGLDELNASYAQGEITEEEYRNRSAAIGEEIQALYGQIETILAPDRQELQERGEALQADQQAFQQESRSGELPPLSEQIEQLESMNESEVADTVAVVLGEDGSDRAYAFMPTGFEPGSGEASATMIILSQATAGQSFQGSASDRIIDSQLDIRAIGEAAFGGGDALVFGSGIIADEVNRSMSDSLSIVGPLALLFVLVVLVIAYRDLLDIVLGLVGIFLVLMWTFGFMGWLDIAFNQIMIAVPVLLIGLSIDYAIHIFMRHREEREDNGGPKPSMKVALAGVGVALLWVTATTVIGFLSNLTSPVPPIRDFGIVSAFGIVAALVIFGVLMPAVKASLDGWLESKGIDRQKRAFGTGGGRFSQALSVGATAAKKAPWLIVILTLVVSAGGVYGATQVNTTFNQEDFIADQPADWMQDLPEPFAPGDYQVKQTLGYVNDNFVRENSEGIILIRGNVTNPETLARIDEATDSAAERDVTVTLSNGEAAVTSPLSSMRQVAAQNATFNATFTAADTDGDGVPDQNITQVYDGFYDAAPSQAAQVVYRTDDGEYEALRMAVSVVGGASGQAVTGEMRDLAAIVASGDTTAIATGTPIVNKIVQDQLLDTVIQSLVITLVVSFIFLMIVYRITDGSATLGLVTLLPVAFNVTWILGTMYLAGIPFNVLTGMITSLTVGLGVAYSIHVSERFSLELGRTDSVWAAMDETVTGTGGALLGSAATTVGGFGVLAFAILPPLQQFGIITGMTIIYAFLASVLILPSLLALWARYVGPGIDDPDSDDADDDTPDDGGDAAPVAATNGHGAPASDAGSGMPAPTPDRTVRPRHVEPGGQFRDVITVSNATGRTVVRETAPGETVTVAAIEPEPMQRAQIDGTVYALWNLEEPTDLRIELAVDLADDSIDGEEPAFDGTLRTAEGAVGIGGDTTVAVVADPFDRLLAKGEVDDDDLALATDQFTAGQLTRRQFERIYAAWVDGETEATAEEQSTPRSE
jgi:predicted RND superfamily exporter protein